MESRYPRVAKTLLKIKMGGLTPLDIKINYKGTVIKTGDISIERAK